jgi:hypothetical protein
MALFKRSVELFALALLALCSHVHSSLVSIGLLPPYSVGTINGVRTKLPRTISVAGLVPMTVIADTFSADEFAGLMANWSSADDVFNPGFLQGTYLLQGYFALTLNLAYHLQSLISVSIRMFRDCQASHSRKSIPGEASEVLRKYKGFLETALHTG